MNQPVSGDPRWSRSRGYWGIVVVSVLIQAVLFRWLFRGHQGALLDDAFISFRYAWRWAQGFGLTWNDGVAVEGFSNPLWTLCLGGLARAGLLPEKIAPFLGWGAAVGTVLILLFLARRRGFTVPAASILLGGAALDVGLILWAGSGLETALAALVVGAWLLGAATAVREEGTFRLGVVLGGLGSSMALLRPEGVLWAFWGLLWLIWGAWARPRVLWGVVLGTLPLVAYGLFRIHTYGHLLPNTFFAKVEPGPTGFGFGVEDSLRWSLAHVALLVPALLPVRRRQTTREPSHAPRLWLLLPAGWLALQTLFVLAVGGDWMGSTRYLAPLAPALALLAAEGWNRRESLRHETRRVWGGVAAVLAVHVLLGLAIRDQIPTYTLQGKALGEWLSEVAEPGDVVAVTAAGAIPYFSRLPAHDVLGINDPEVVGRRAHRGGAWAPGHQRYDLDRLMKLRPRWIVWDFGIKVNQHRIRKLKAKPPTDPGKLDYRRALLARGDFRNLYTIEHGTPVMTQSTYTVFRLR